MIQKLWATRWARWALGGAAGIALLGSMASACSGPSNAAGQTLEQNSSNQSQTIAEETLPAPVFKYSEIRWVTIEAEASEALGEQTTSFAFQQGDPNPIFSCPSIGYPVANTAQLTNPQKVVHDSYPQGGAALTVGNMDPNQIYPPPASQGTNILCVNRTGQFYLAYSEPNVVTVAGSAIWVDGKGIVMNGAPNMPSCKVLNAGTRKAQTVCTK